MKRVPRQLLILFDLPNRAFTLSVPVASFPAVKPVVASPPPPSFSSVVGFGTTPWSVAPECWSTGLVAFSAHRQCTRSRWRRPLAARSEQTGKFQTSLPLRRKRSVSGRQGNPNIRFERMVTKGTRILLLCTLLFFSKATVASRIQRSKASPSPFSR